MNNNQMHNAVIFSNILNNQIVHIKVIVCFDNYDSVKSTEFNKTERLPCLDFYS